MFFGTNLESADSYRFAGQTVTLSYYARAGANYSPTSSGLSANILTGTGTDQSFITGLTGSTNAGNATATLTTSWQRFTVTGTIGSTATQIAVYFSMTPTGTAGANDYFEVTGVQLEVGNQASPFIRAAGGTIQGELAACQRYCTVYDNGNTMIGMAVAASTSAIGRMIVTNPVTWRTTPSITLSGTNLFYDGVNTPAIGTLGTIYAQQNMVNFETSGSGTLVQHRPYQLWNSTGKIILSAEL
jgi:hypothetical protein